MIQETLFNKHIETWEDSLKPNKSYYIAKGRLDRVNPNYSSVHKEVELAFTDSTIIKETEHEVPTDKFSDGFSSLEHADKFPNGAILAYGGDKTYISIPKFYSLKAVQLSMEVQQNEQAKTRGMFTIMVFQCQKPSNKPTED
ncbi:hypothetical protein H5410_048748 [Solanum commersonii]|uniref:Uncharacterized protein n=1 Tax=Solanum commersonii TaxID=4109 RepID=A0A9J5XKN9_SOLCO|nr:hypothetical protein H5410_048748 [Solanum commersonii]